VKSARPPFGVSLGERAEVAIRIGSASVFQRLASADKAPDHCTRIDRSGVFAVGVGLSIPSFGAAARIVSAT
jgi:hypothetical protein